MTPDPFDSTRRGRSIGAERLERRVLFAVGFLDVAIGDGQAGAVSFVDADGTAARVSVRGASAVVRFTGDGLAQAPAGRDVVVSGAGGSVASVTATGTSRRTAIAFTASGGDERLTVGHIAADGPVAKVDAPNVVLTGSLATGGAAARINLLRTENASLTLGGGAGKSSIVIREDAVDTDLHSASPVERLDV